MKERKCWANSLDNCEGGISGEHVISKSILDKNSPIEITHLDGSIDLLTHGNLRINKLCKRHNNQLSNYDTEIAILAKCLDHRSSRDYIDSFNGTLNGFFLEKWFAKTSVNYYLRYKYKQYLDIDYITKVVFSDSNFYYPNGLWYCDFLPNTKRPIAIKDLYIMPVFNEDEIKGFGFILYGHRFLFVPPNCKFEIPKWDEYNTNFGDSYKRMFYGDLGIYRVAGFKTDSEKILKIEYWI